MILDERMFEDNDFGTTNTNRPELINSLLLNLFKELGVDPKVASSSMGYETIVSYISFIASQALGESLNESVDEDQLFFELIHLIDNLNYNGEVAKEMSDFDDVYNSLKKLLNRLDKYYSKDESLEEKFVGDLEVWIDNTLDEAGLEFKPYSGHSSAVGILTNRDEKYKTRRPYCDVYVLDIRAKAENFKNRFGNNAESFFIKWALRKLGVNNEVTGEESMNNEN